MSDRVYSGEECEEFVECVLYIGSQMVRNGAEVRRAEDTMQRISEAYGFTVMSTYAVPSQVELCLKSPDGEHYTQAVRIPRTWNDLGRVEELNAEARKICAEKPAILSMREQIKAYEVTKTGRWIEVIGYCLSAFGFTMFFGGNVFDSLIALAVSIVVFLMNHYMRLRKQNTLVFTMVACFISASLAELALRLGLCTNIDKVLSGIVMLFIPGLAVVNGIKEMFYRDLTTGLLRIMEALLMAASIAAGFGLSIYLFSLI